MNSVVFWALDRAKEPSTWAGLAGLAMVFGISAEQWQTIGTAVAAVAAAIAMFVSEAKCIGYRPSLPSAVCSVR